MLTAVEAPYHNSVTVPAQRRPSAVRLRKQRVTITLPLALLERLRNAVYWTGHATLARLIADALDIAVTKMEEANGRSFPQRLAPLKRGRPRIRTRPPAASARSV